MSAKHIIMDADVVIIGAGLTLFLLPFHYIEAYD